MNSVFASAFAIVLVFSGVASAQSYSPGASYANPDNTTTDVARKRGPCGDPWVTIALERVHGRAEPAKCNVKLYNNGQWRDFNQLVHAVARAQSSAALPSAGAMISRNEQYAAPAGSARATPGVMKLADVQAKIRSNGGKLSLNEAQQMVAAGGGNFTMAQVLQMVAAGGGNLVGNDGASYRVQNDGSLLAANGAKFLVQGSNVVPTHGGGLRR